ncbi:MAG: hypothetical protein JSS91_06230 [Bacteroidetes bacterium]|nr:hypothetical protein [Bacteroidota bacterium]
MISRLLNLILIFLCVTFYSCEQNSTGVNNSEEYVNLKYPFTLNSFWYYTTKNVTVNIRPDSIKNYFNQDTLTGFGISEFISDTVIYTDTLRILKNEFSLSGHSSVTYEYYLQTDSGLIRKAYLFSGSNLGPYRGDIMYEYNKKIFNSAEDIFLRADLNLSNTDTLLTIDDPPVRVLKYPAELNTDWSLFSSDYLKIRKKYTGFQNVSIFGNKFRCAVISRYFYFNSSLPDNNYIFTDYFSKEGIVKREILIKDISILNKTGEQIGLIDLSELSYVTIYNIR